MIRRIPVGPLCAYRAEPTDVHRARDLSEDGRGQAAVPTGAARLLDGHRPAARLLEGNESVPGVPAEPPGRLERAGERERVRDGGVGEGERAEGSGAACVGRSIRTRRWDRRAAWVRTW